MSTAEKFYSETLGLNVRQLDMGVLEISTNGDSGILVYPKPDHQPASFTVLNFPVDDLERTVDELTEKGMVFEQYDEQIKTNEKGICYGKENEPSLAGFKDPAGNILSLLLLAEKKK